MAEEIQEDPQTLGPGAQLKARREALNLSVEDIADRLHLRPSVVEGLENDLYDHTVSMTFTKGYVRLYAKHLELPPEPLLELFEQLTNPIKQPAKLRSFSQKVAKQASDARLMMVTWFIILVMIGLAGVWWWQLPDDSTLVPTAIEEPVQSPSGQTEQPAAVQGNEISQNEEFSATVDNSDMATENSESVSEETLNQQTLGNSLPTEENALSQASEPSTGDLTESETSVNSADSDSLSNESSDVSGDLTPPDQMAEPEETESLQEPIVDTAQQNDDEFTTAAEQSDSATQQSLITDAAPLIEGTRQELNVSPLTSELVFTFSEDCWMNLTDATGEVIAYGVKSAGRVMEVAGIPPFEVVLGAPQGVQLIVDGETFDMSGFPAGRTARFTVGEAQ